MTTEQIQFLFDSAIRSQFAWKRKAAQLYRVGIKTLQSAADAKDTAQSIHKGESRTLTPEELEAFEEFNLYEVGLLLGICFLREAPERAIGTDRRAGLLGICFLR